MVEIVPGAIKETNVKEYLIGFDFVFKLFLVISLISLLKELYIDKNQASGNRTHISRVKIYCPNR
jgi:hypothetical protein